MMRKSKILDTVKSVLALLIEKKYKEVYELDCRKLLSETEIQKGIEDFGLQLTALPSKNIKGLEIYEIDGDNEVYIDVELWYDGKQSDITLSISIIDEQKEEYNFSIRHYSVKVCNVTHGRRTLCNELY